MIELRVNECRCERVCVYICALSAIYFMIEMIMNIIVVLAAAAVAAAGAQRTYEKPLK